MSTSDTPRTDAQPSTWESRTLAASYSTVPKDFAKQLERELTAAQEHAERLHSELTRVIKCASNFGARVRERTPHWFEEPKGFTDFSDADHALRAALIDGQEALAAPSGQRFFQFGELVWKYIEKMGGDFCEMEISEDILPLALESGLCRRVTYDPAKHGEYIEADPGSEIWFWGEESAPETIAQEGGENTKISDREDQTQ